MVTNDKRHHASRCVCVCVCAHVVMGIPPRERGAIAVARFDCCYHMQVRQLCQIWSYLFHASETTLPNMVISLSEFEDLMRLEYITPVVSYLCHENCQDNGTIIEVWPQLFFSITVCTCTCTCMCVHVCVCMYVCACMYMHVCVCACMYMHVYVCVHVCTCMCMCVCMCVCACMYMRVCVCACMYMHVCVCACMYMRVCVCACMYMHVYVCACIRVLEWGRESKNNSFHA